MELHTADREPIYDLSLIDIPDFGGEEQSSKEKTCPGLQRFCPHYTSEVCDVKYSECVLLNSLKTSETILRTEREKLLKDPTPQNLASIAQINDVLGDRNPDMQVDPAAIIWNKRKGRLVAAGLFLLISAAAMLMYVG
ncbi:hypothetical protein GF339_22050 [candidate division KSB3 bacterium]|jgi:hypothetical protein|uniref:Uncharacterized protein n=1 Tax=candidate division KSB3 bacterium TaxID=2044937 RepID=A0A9D5Q7V2_9BACT|nr:hypothetical protein [candidate division KSB3 bacterium]MBD3327285.1 hypothetical protein [candidate division KSB3 bacterium]